ncbi:MAG: hypothetical protein BIFFINMI_03615 [Phycisphaerae bacterium]|nr:hypothetical protein [Phycisphaerae bacterium]
MRRSRASLSWIAAALAAFAVLPVAAALADDGQAPPREFRVKRQEVYEFTTAPSVRVEGDKATISFASKAFCDVTVVIERPPEAGDDGEPEILRHLASGVLGANAPAPLVKNSLAQSIVWDGKDDQGRYLDKAPLRVRVSLGLAPRFERTLFWSPYKRISNIAPLLAAAPEGVYAFEGQGVDYLRLFDHDGNYLRTVYPFPAAKIDDVVGLQKHRFVQDGQELPLKIGYTQATLLSSGSSGAPEDTGGHYGGYAASAMAVRNGRIALAYMKLNRLASDGGSGGLPLEGPPTGFEVYVGRLKRWVGPTSMAFSPDGKYLYMTGFVWKTAYWATHGDCFHCVLRMEYAKNDAPTLFAGSVKHGDYGKGDNQFTAPLAVACDSKGRVYVADHVNSRVQVLDSDGKFLKSLPTPWPADLQIDPATDEVWAFSWGAIGPDVEIQKRMGMDMRRMPTTLVNLGTFDKPSGAKPQSLPVVAANGNGGWTENGGQVYKTALDFWAAAGAQGKPGGASRLWVVGRRPTVGVDEMNWSGGGTRQLSGWAQQGVRIFAREDSEWKPSRDFAADAAKAVGRVEPPPFGRQRLYVNPRNHRLYIAEDMTHFGKSFYELLEFDPSDRRGRPPRRVELPFDAEDIAFDINGLAYLRTDGEVMRFDPAEKWREIPWDYGEERQAVGFSSGGEGRRSPAVSALALPGHRPVFWHHAGLWVNANGNMAVTCYVRTQKEDREEGGKDKYLIGGGGKPYAPQQYPGRAGQWVVNVWDKHGRLIYEDAVPGLPGGDGIGIDAADNLYVMVAADRVLDGRPYFNEKSETLMKFPPKGAKIVSASDRAPVPLPKEQTPDGSADFTKYAVGMSWAKGAEWGYGGVGYGGQGGSCVCWHARFQLDFLARSFAPEMMRYHVAVLDSAGNLVTRIGRYGNVDDGQPLIAVAGPAQTHSIGGDEVALMHAGYVGVDTDRRLYICDAGNGRILSVKLGYHTTQTVALQSN